MATKVTQSLARNIKTVEGNPLVVFVDQTDGALKVKDVDGIVEPVTNYTGSGGTSGIQTINSSILIYPKYSFFIPNRAPDLFHYFLFTHI